MTNESLSEKQIKYRNIQDEEYLSGLLSVKDIKEAVKKLKEWVNQRECYEGYSVYTKGEAEDMLKIIDEIFGEELTK